MKKNVLKDYRNLPENIREEIRDMYPNGFVNHMITFFDKDKHLVSALPYDTEEISYLIKMPSSIYLDQEEEEEEIQDPIESLTEEPILESLGKFEDEKYLIQEEEEEESD